MTGKTQEMNENKTEAASKPPAATPLKRLRLHLADLLSLLQLLPPALKLQRGTRCASTVTTGSRTCVSTIVLKKESRHYAARTANSHCITNHYATSSSIFRCALRNIVASANLTTTRSTTAANLNAMIAKSSDTRRFSTSWVQRATPLLWRTPRMNKLRSLALTQCPLFNLTRH
jgi:hypothetical protein